MRLLTIDCREVAGRPGALLDSGEILDLATAPSTLAEAQWIPPSVVSIIAAGDDGLQRVQRLVDAEQALGPQDREQMRLNGTLLPYATTALMAPIRRPGLVLIAGSGRSADHGSGSSPFIKSPNTVVGHGAVVRVPPSQQGAVDCTGMLGAVLGKPLYQADEEEAHAAIAAYTLLLDLTMPVAAAVDAAVSWRRYIDGKQFPGACPIGPVMITADELHPSSAPDAVIRVNDCIVSDSLPDREQVSIAAELSALSRRYGFRPGDVMAVEPSCRPCRLHDGDRVSIALPGLAQLEVTVRLHG